MIDEAREAVVEDGWIPAADAPPWQWGHVWNGACVNEAHFNPTDREWYEHGRVMVLGTVTHWRPMPPLPAPPVTTAVPVSDGWIPVGERLPELYTSVLVWAATEGHVAHCDEDKDFFDGVNYLRGVTHWREMPDPPTQSGATAQQGRVNTERESVTE